MKANLKDIRILIAESDNNLGMLLTQVLQRMGLTNTQLVRDGKSALEVLQQEHKDILLTEWHLHAIDGISLTNHIRSADTASDRLMPIIMVTGRAEKQDVELARDAGITEFVVKPYNSVTVFKRIQQVIDNPRAFLLAQEYVGPDRRRRDLPRSGEDRRRERPLVVPAEKALVDETPKLILPEQIIKNRIGLNEPLDAIITPQVLAGAQEAIENLKDESLLWIRQYVQAVEWEYKQLLQHPAQAGVEKMMELLLAIKGNAGTFGYTTASQLAQQLYQFMRFDYSLSSSKHNHVLLKHVQSLVVVLSTSAEGRSLEKEGWLLNGLKMMIAKFQKDKS